MTTMEIILVTLVAAICGMGSVLDERQTHRPLVACTLIGLVLGDLETGIIVGGTLELVALGWMNVGLIECKSSLSMCLKYRDLQGCNW